MSTEILLAFSVLVLLGWWLRRRRLRDTVGGRTPVVTDDLMRRIVEEGQTDPDEEDGEPLDEGEIRAAEDRFWEETEWEEPEEFGH